MAGGGLDDTTNWYYFCSDTSIQKYEDLASKLERSVAIDSGVSTAVTAIPTLPTSEETVVHTQWEHPHQITEFGTSERPNRHVSPILKARH